MPFQPVPAAQTGCRPAALLREQFIKSIGHIFTGKLEWVGGRTGWSQVALQAFKQPQLSPSKPGSDCRQGKPKFGLKKKKKNGKFLVVAHGLGSGLTRFHSGCSNISCLKLQIPNKFQTNRTPGISKIGPFQLAPLPRCVVQTWWPTCSESWGHSPRVNIPHPRD